MNALEAQLVENDRVGRGMAQWRRERPDIDCSGKAIVGRILHLHDIILRAVERVLQQHQLKYPTYAVLATMRVSGAPYRMSPGELSDALLLTSGGLSNLLRRMEADGYVQRSPDKRDKRGVVVQLTAKGIAKADASMADHAETERALVACLSPDDQKNVARALGLMIATSTAR